MSIVSESKLVLLPAQQANKIKTQGVEARNNNFIWKASRLRRW